MNFTNPIDIMDSEEVKATMSLTHDIILEVDKRGDKALADLLIDQNKMTMEIMSTARKLNDLMQGPEDILSDEFLENTHKLGVTIQVQGMELSALSLRTQLILIDRHPDLALEVFKKTTINQLSLVLKGIEDYKEHMQDLDDDLF